MEKKFQNLKRILKNTGTTLGGMTEMFAGFALVGPAALVAIPLIYDGAVRAANGITGIKSNKSMMVTTEAKWNNMLFRKKENSITQNIPSLSQLFTALATKDKKSFLITNELNFLLGANKIDKNGNPIKYSTKSQSLTRFMLNSAKKAGFIENFECEETDSQTLIAEKIMFGNFGKNMNKKEKMFNMSFNISNKEITEEDISKFLRVESLDEKRFNIRRDKEGKIVSINQRLTNVISERVGEFKTNMLTSKKANKMLTESKEKSLDDIDKTKFVNELQNLVNPICKTPEVKTVEKREKESLDENVL